MKKITIILLSLLVALSLVACSSSSKPTEETEVVNEEAQFVVIGGGAAGMSAAIKAAENGLNVVLLEKQSFLGGASAMASTGINAGGSDLQNATETPYTADMFFDYAKSWDYGYDRIGYRVVPVSEDYAYTFAYRSAEAASFISSLGVEMKATAESHSLQLVSTENGKFGAVYTAALSNKMNEFENIDVRTGSKATKLITDENGAICGVEVEGPEGTYTMNTTAVLLATGGYSTADSKFFQTYAPEWDGYNSTGAAGATGDGIVLAAELNAKLLGMDAITCTTITSGEPNKAGAVTLTTSLKNGAILINEEGSRFVIETAKTAEMMEAVKAQTNHDAWLIADQSVYDASADLKLVSTDVLKTYESIDELAEGLNLSVETIDAMLEAYRTNEGDLALETLASTYETGPYYVVSVQPAKRISTGGIVTNGKAEVLDENDAVITGLYAAGEVTAYGAHPLSASTIFGLQAADSAAEFLAE